MLHQEWTDAQWTEYARQLLEVNRAPRLLGFEMEYVQGAKACVSVKWKDELGQLPENPIYNGLVIMGLADQAGCIAVAQVFGNLNVVTVEFAHKFLAGAPAEHRLYAVSGRTSYHTNPNKIGDPRLKGAEVEVKTFVKDYRGQEEFVVGASVVKIVWLGGPEAYKK